MTPKEIAAHYSAKIFDTPEAAQDAGFVLTETAAPRNVWNKASAASAIVLKLVERRESGEVEDIGLGIEPFQVTGCYKPQPAEAPAAYGTGFTRFFQDASSRNRDNSGNTARQPRDGAEHGAAAPVHARRVARRSQ